MENEVSNNTQVNESALIEQLEARQRELDAREIRLFAQSELIKRGLGEDAGEFVDLSGRENCVKSIERLQKLIGAEAARIMDKSLSNRTLPGAAAKLDFDSLSDREYYEMRLAGRRQNAVKSE